MTMPHLQNCDHSENGWCLDCVRKLHRDTERIDFLATCYDGWPIVEQIDHKHDTGSEDIYDRVADYTPDDWEPSDGIQLDDMQRAFRDMIDEAINEFYSFGEPENA